MISLREKLVFIHQIKTGGNSVNNALKNISHFDWHHKSNQNGGQEGFGFRNYNKHANMREAISVIKKLGYDPKEFFYFTTIRNPWDWWVSKYEFSRFNPMDPAGFRNWLNKQNQQDKLGQTPISFWDPDRLYKNDENIQIDKYLSFENLSADFDHLMQVLGLDEKVEKLSENARKNVSQRAKKGIHYSDYYTKKEEEIIANHEKWLIEEFGYEF
jgi:hypothetical protein